MYMRLCYTSLMINEITQEKKDMYREMFLLDLIVRNGIELDTMNDHNYDTMKDAWDFAQTPSEYEAKWNDYVIKNQKVLNRVQSVKHGYAIPTTPRHFARNMASEIVQEAKKFSKSPKYFTFLKTGKLTAMPAVWKERIAEIKKSEFAPTSDFKVMDLINEKLEKERISALELLEFNARGQDKRRLTLLKKHGVDSVKLREQKSQFDKERAFREHVVEHLI